MLQQSSAFTEQLVRERSQRRGEPSWLLDDRLAALKRYQSLPLESSPLFTRHTEGPKRLEPGRGGAAPKLAGPSVRGAGLRELAASEELQAVLTNDLPGFEHDQLSNLPRALFTTGASLHVAAGVRVEEPFTVRYEATDAPQYARNVVVLERDARGTLLVEAAGHGEGTLAMTLEVLLGEGAELRLLGVDTTGAAHTGLVTMQARTGERAALEVHHAYLGGSLTKVRTDVVLKGRGSRVKHGEVVFGKGQQRFDLTTNITHAGPETTSEALSKAVLKDGARAGLKGVIVLLQEGKDSDSYLQQHAMLLSKQARCVAIPSLEIINREIKRAKHAATVAQVDEAQVFYLQTRGLSEDEARKAIVIGFLTPLLERLGEAQAERVRGAIEAAWQ